MIFKTMDFVVFLSYELLS